MPRRRQRRSRIANWLSSGHACPGAVFRGWIPPHFNNSYNRNTNINRNVNVNNNFNRSNFNNDSWSHSDSWDHNDGSKSSAFSGWGGSHSSGGFSDSGWSSRADSNRGWGSMRSSGFGGGRFGGGGLGADSVVFAAKRPRGRKLLSDHLWKGLCRA